MNVDGFVRVVCGVTEETTCQDVVIALAHAMGRTGRFSLLEKWRIQERSLPPWERPLQVLQKWGEYAAEVQFTLQQTDREEVRKATDAINKVGINPPERCTRNFSPPPPVESNVKRSLTFSGAHGYSQPPKMCGSNTFMHSSIPHNTSKQCTPSYQSTKHSQTHCAKQDYHQYHQPQTSYSQPPKHFCQNPNLQPRLPEAPPPHKIQPNWPQNISTHSKPISSIKPQPKPRTLPLKTITEKLPSRTVGTVSPIQNHERSTSVGHANFLHHPLPQDEARVNLGPMVHHTSVPETIKMNYSNRINHDNNINNNDYGDDDFNSNSSNNSALQVSDNYNSDEDSVDSSIPDLSTQSGNLHIPRLKNCFNEDIMSMKANNLAQIEEYDLDKNFPLSLRSSPDTNSLTERHAECYVIQGENEFEREPSEDPDSQALLQLINIQHEELELQKVRMKDIDLEIISAEELIETETQISELQSLSDSNEEELARLESWPQILEEQHQTEQVLHSEMTNCRQKIDECEDRLQKAQSRISELTEELELEVSKIEQEISDVQRKIKEGVLEGDEYQEKINDINKEISDLDFEVEKKQMEEMKISAELKQLNLKELGEKPMLEATKLSETGEVILKLLEKQQQFTRQGSGSSKSTGSKTESEAVAPTCAEPKSITTDGVWV